MAKQREATGLDNKGKWRLLSGMTDIFIPHEIQPFEAKLCLKIFLKTKLHDTQQRKRSFRIKYM